MKKPNFPCNLYNLKDSKQRQKFEGITFEGSKVIDAILTDTNSKKAKISNEPGETLLTI